MVQYACLTGSDILFGETSSCPITFTFPPVARVFRNGDDVSSLETQFTLLNPFVCKYRLEGLCHGGRGCGGGGGGRASRRRGGRGKGLRFVADQADIRAREPPNLPVELAGPPAVALLPHSDDVVLCKGELVFFAALPREYCDCTEICGWGRGGGRVEGVGGVRSHHPHKICWKDSLKVRTTKIARNAPTCPCAADGSSLKEYGQVRSLRLLNYAPV